MKILILDPPGGALRSLCLAFEHVSKSTDEVKAVTRRADLMRRLGSAVGYDLVVIDHDLGDGKQSGFEVLAAVRALDSEIPVVIVAEEGGIDIARRALEAGATDFLVRSRKLRERVLTLMTKLRQVLELVERNRRLDAQNVELRTQERARWAIIGDSSQIAELVKKTQRVATVPRPVLITGERGSGKELVARAVHAASPQVDGPFVPINCAAFADSLLVRELFGHERGAFTGAQSRMTGKFEQADKGTLFLDEIGNMTLPFQRKILRVVEYSTFTRVGGSSEVSVSTRVVAATNSDLEARMKSGEFLRDLYDRLAFEVIHVPPLRDRDGDVEVLAQHFLECFMQEVPAFQGKRLSKEAVKKLRNYRFPGNVRELKNIIERAVYRDTTNEITPEDIGMLSSKPTEIAGANFKEKVEAFESQLIRDALQACAGNQARAARKLGLSYHQYRYYLKKYGAAAASS